MRILNLLALLAVPAILTAPTGQAAQNKFPEKPIRLIVGSAAGSGPDIIGRMMAERLYETWKQRVVVDARPGAAGAISADLALGAAADGYTWMMLTSQLFVASQVLADIKFDLARDFQSLSLIGTTPFVLLANNQLPAKSLKELIELAKKQPGKLRYGSAGTGASEHLSGVLLNHLTGTNMLHVPYKGVPQSIADTLHFALKQNFAFAAFNILMPYPKTPLYDKLTLENRHLFDGKWWLAEDYHFNQAAFVPKNLEPDELTRLCREMKVKWSSPVSIFRRFFANLNFKTIGHSLFLLRMLFLFKTEALKKNFLMLGYFNSKPKQ